MANYSKVLTADGVVTSGSCTVKGVIVGAAGATAGDLVVLRDGGATGDILLYLVVGAANGTTVVNFPEGGLNFGTSCYYSEQAAASGKLRATIIL